MDNSDDEGVAFKPNALDVVGSWLLGGDGDDVQEEGQQHLERQTQRRPVTLYRPSSASSGKSLPSLTRPNASYGNADETLTEQEREMKRKLLRKPRSRRVEESVKAEKESQQQRDEAQDEEEQELVRLKTQSNKDDRKRKRTSQDDLLEKLREEAAKKKIKNLKRKLQLKRKKQQQNRVTAAY
ncbi:uncharacterized protein PITG_20263 [Phytophthora infestans T30-4]|uniref:Uncharacterized protein n=2 Tax=Phytophthora infestans TaxID=4787 RepID=D0P2D1_PHYIT|nr:uncharacterized protein PITG_20263 [Phytophthora infestans T30-4]EEY55888.1 conserved hypothetical protein [Phytophthora infestans T30-4]KAF4144614.1 hypothetical protein GN958_ATG06194 [Phytophthora infestans]|eukprot:XP_002895551.1 conserved hypothetical protein [Phytophthora infestans T30-4]